MSTQVEGVFEVTLWSEEQTTGLEGTAKVTTARLGQRFAGGIEAETIADMVMTHGNDGTADFVGYQRVHGRIGEKSGTFVLQSTGRFDGRKHGRTSWSSLAPRPLNSRVCAALARQSHQLAPPERSPSNTSSEVTADQAPKRPLARRSHGQ